MTNPETTTCPSSQQPCELALYCQNAENFFDPANKPQPVRDIMELNHCLTERVTLLDQLMRDTRTGEPEIHQAAFTELRNQLSNGSFMGDLQNQAIEQSSHEV